LVTDDLRATARAIVADYLKRWAIEEYQPHYTSSACFYRLAA